MSDGAGTALGAVAIFDFDRTITRHGTFTPFLLFTTRSHRRKLLWLPVILAHMVRYKVGIISRKRLKEHMLALFLGPVTRVELAAHAAGFVDKIIASGLKPGALECIARHRADGDRLVMATASMDFYAEVVGRRLGFDQVIATRSRWADGEHLSPEIEGENCYGEAKVDMILRANPELAAKVPDRKKVIAYSDHVSDLPLLLLADKAIAVDPSAGLKREAARRKFLVQNWD